jgi:PAS domain S-box-containing protein
MISNKRHKIAEDIWFRTAVETMMDGFAIFSAIRNDDGHIADFRYEYINESGCRLNQRTREEQIGHTLLELLSFHKGSGLLDDYIRVVETGQRLVKENYIYEDLYGGGQRLSRTFDFRAVKFGDGFAVTWRDVTEHKRAEENILHLNRLYSMLSKVNEAIVRIPDPEKLYERVCRITVEDGQFKMAWIGLTDPESLSVIPVASYGDTGGYLKDIKIYAADVPEGRGPTGKAVFEDIYSICGDIENDPRMLPWCEKALRHGFRSSAAFPLHAGSSVIGAFTIYSSKPQFFTDEERSLLSSLAEDISFAISSLANEKKKLAAEEALRESEERYRSLFYNSIDGILLTSPDGSILAANPEACRIFGRTEEEICAIGREGIVDMTDPKVIAFLDERAHTGKARGEITGIRKDGTKFPCEQSSALFKDKEGNIRTSMIVRDISERKKTEEELTKYREHLEDLVKQRTAELEKMTNELKRSNADLQQFAYAVSHDLQEPLNGMAMFLKLFEKRYKGKFDNKADEFLDFMVDGMGRMKMLIKDLLAYSKVEIKGRSLELTNFSVTLEEAIFNLRSAIEESGAKLTYDLLPSVVADASQITRLFQNLIGNAIKYHGKDKPEIHISAQKKGDEWVFSVRDNGIGIESKYFEKIFDVFRRLHSIVEYKGTGIGLAICKKIVERHGGRIWVESAPGVGSIFYFTLPSNENNT